MVNESHEQGVLEENEAEMIGNIFEFGEKQASDVMTHRNNIVALDDDSQFISRLTDNALFTCPIISLSR